ncbi:MAG: hypothetical protein AB1589_23330 [Cyanobacteriota bacterium]
MRSERQSFILYGIQPKNAIASQKQLQVVELRQGKNRKNDLSTRNPSNWGD